MTSQGARAGDTIGFRRDAAGRTVEDEAPSAPRSAAGKGTDPDGAKPRRRLLIAAAALGAGAWIALGGLALAGRGPFADAAEPAAAAHADPAVAGVAEAFVAAYLESGDDADPGLDGLTTGRIDRQGMQAGERYVRRADAVALGPDGAGRWTVTVVADVLVAVEGGYAPAATRWFTVPVDDTGPRPLVAQAPAEIAPRPPVDVAVPATAPAPADVAKVAGAAVASHLTGKASADPALPDPYETVNVLEVTVTDAADGGEVRAHVRVAAVDAQDRRLVLGYEARLEKEAGRWRVVELEG